MMEWRNNGIEEWRNDGMAEWWIAMLYETKVSQKWKHSLIIEQKHSWIIIEDRPIVEHWGSWTSPLLVTITIIIFIYHCSYYYLSPINYWLSVNYSTFWHLSLENRNNSIKRARGAYLLLVPQGRVFIWNRAPSRDRMLISFKEKEECETKHRCIFDWGWKRLENRLVPGSFLARTTS